MTGTTPRRKRAEVAGNKKKNIYEDICCII